MDGKKLYVIWQEMSFQGDHHTGIPENQVLFATTQQEVHWNGDAVFIRRVLCICHGGQSRYQDGKVIIRLFPVKSPRTSYNEQNTFVI